MSSPRHTADSKRLGLMGLALLALYGCASSGSTNGSGGGEDGGSDANAGSGGSSSTGSGGKSAGSGGSSGAASGGISGSGGAQGSGGAAATGGRTGSGGSSSSATGGATGTGGSTSPHCSTSIVITSPASGPIEAGADAVVRVTALAYEFPTMKLTWTWVVMDYAGNLVTPTTAGDDHAVAQFPVPMKGSYLVKATPSGDPLCIAVNQTVPVVDPQGPSFNFRTWASGYPTQDKTVKQSDGLGGGTLQLEPGKSFTVKPIDPLSGKLLDSYVRITSSNQAFAFESNTTMKPVMTSLLATQSYNLLIAPMDAASGAGGAGSVPGTANFAPYVQFSMPDSWQGLEIDQGLRIAGQTVTAGGTPLQNARMQLRSSAGTPSTIGYSDATGALTLWARDGKMSAVVIPPDGSGLPTAMTADGAITVPMGASLSLTMQWEAPAQSTLTVQVRAADGTSPVANAKVRLTSAGMPYSPGTLTVQSSGADDVMVPTTAAVTDSLQTGADGQVTFPPYPAGSYTLTIIPPATAAPAAVTTVPVTLTAGAATQTVALAKQVTLTGTLAGPTGPVAGQVTAIDIGNACTTGAPGCPAAGTPAPGTSAATGSVVAGQADASGSFSLTVDPDRTYELIVQPTAASALGRAVRSAFRLCSTATAPCTAPNVSSSMVTITVPPGVPYHGTLAGSGGAPVGGAAVQVFCALASATCDPDVSLAEATSLADGTFTVILPVPAQSSAALSR